MLYPIEESLGDICLAPALPMAYLSSRRMNTRTLPGMNHSSEPEQSEKKNFFFSQETGIGDWKIMSFCGEPGHGRKEIKSGGEGGTDYLCTR